MSRIVGEPFRYKGVHNVEDCTTSEDVMIKAGLNWTVDKCELYGRMRWNDENPNYDQNGFKFSGDYFNDVPNAYGVYRTDINLPLGVVKERYEPVQNVEAFNFFDDAIGKNQAIWQTAGCWNNGKKVFVTAKLPHNIIVGGKDPVENYLVFMTSHDGSMGVNILLTPIRVRCQNALNAAIKCNIGYITFRHTASVHSNINQAHEILGICKKKIEYVAEAYNELQSKTISDLKARRVFAEVILTGTELENLKATGHTVEELIERNWNAMNDAKISSKKTNMLANMNGYYYTGAGQREIVGTAWGVYNAITGYYSNAENNVGEKRMDSLLYGDRSRKIEFAGNLLLAA
jgi:phage/plasmid-like protein (TIGR03299 family)